ncbi:unnamed protein product, partial [Brassica rapa subsp. narinosa]
ARHLATPHVISVAAPRLPPSVASSISLPIAEDLKPRQPISLLFSSEGLMVDRLRLFTSSLVSVMVEVDRILRPQGTFIVNDGMEKIGEIEKMMESLKWNVRMTHSRYGEGVISVQKSWWRPTEVETITSAIASERELV